MNWKLGPGWHTQTCGAYTVTKHEIAAGGWFYIAWHDKQELSTHDTAEAARAACDAHSGASA